MEKKKAKPSRIVGIVLCVVLAIVLLGNITVIIKGTIDPNRPPGVFGSTSMIVLSGSMSGDAPDHIEVGDMIISKDVDPAALKVGDVISYMEGKSAVTHRIIGINEDGSFKTKGDANPSEDQHPVYPEQIIGLFAYRIPKLGDLALFMQSPMGMIVFIGIPLAIYILLDMLLRARHNRSKEKLAEAAEKDKEDMLAEIERLKAQLSDGKSEEPAAVAEEAPEE